MATFKANPFRPSPNVTPYQALYTHMRTAILFGELKRGMKLPSTRALANESNISHNAVLNAFFQLTAKGYLDGRVGTLPLVTQADMKNRKVKTWRTFRENYSKDTNLKNESEMADSDLFIVPNNQRLDAKLR